MEINIKRSSTVKGSVSDFIYITDLKAFFCYKGQLYRHTNRIRGMCRFALLTRDTSTLSPGSNNSVWAVIDLNLYCFNIVVAICTIAIYQSDSEEILACHFADWE